MCYWICFLFALWGTLFSLEPLSLLQQAKSNSWIALRQGKHFLFLHVLSRQEGALTLEEIITSSPPKEGWARFREKRGQGALSWLIHTIDLRTGKFLASYSYLEQKEICLPERENFLATLLTLSFESIPQEERRKAGPPPPQGEIDRRKLWQPKLVFEGVKQNNVSFLAWRARWPEDGSDLSDRGVIIYTAPEGGPWPAYFPYWVEIAGFLGQAKIQVIDSGNQLLF